MNVKRTETIHEVFGTVNPGEAFSVPYGKTIYIKTDIYTKANGRVIGSDRFGTSTEAPLEYINAIDLSNGTGRYFKEGDLVIIFEDAVVYSED